MKLITSDYKLKAGKIKYIDTLFIYSDDRPTYLSSIEDYSLAIYVDKTIYKYLVDKTIYKYLVDKDNYWDFSTDVVIDFTNKRIFCLTPKEELEVILRANNNLDDATTIEFSKEFISFFNELVDNYIFNIGYEK